jgi:hypothetical protein
VRGAIAFGDEVVVNVTSGTSLKERRRETAARQANAPLVLAE